MHLVMNDMSKRGHIAGALIERRKKEEQPNAELGFGSQRQVDKGRNRNEMAQERLLASDLSLIHI